MASQHTTSATRCPAVSERRPSRRSLSTCSPSTRRQESRNEMEPTPSQSKKFTDYYHGQQDGTNKPMVDTASQRPDVARLAAIKAKLGAGPTAPSDQPTPGDTTDAPPAGVDRDVWAKAQASASDPQSPD